MTNKVFFFFLTRLFFFLLCSPNTCPVFDLYLYITISLLKRQTDFFFFFVFFFFGFVHLPRPTVFSHSASLTAHRVFKQNIQSSGSQTVWHGHICSGTRNVSIRLVFIVKYSGVRNKWNSGHRVVESVILKCIILHISYVLHGVYFSSFDLFFLLHGLSNFSNIKRKLNTFKKIRKIMWSTEFFSIEMRNIIFNFSYLYLVHQLNSNIGMIHISKKFKEKS